MRVLVLGGDGFCGWPTTLYLSDRGHDITIMDNLSRRKIDVELEVESLTPIRPIGERIQVWREVSGREIGFINLDLATEYDRLVAVLEDIREAKKGSGEDEEAWYAATKILGQLYLDELNRPDLAVKAFTDYKEYSKSGADTLYQIGRAYEALGDQKNAIRFYEAVTAYEEHPRYWDAKDAVKRLRGQ